MNAKKRHRTLIVLAVLGLLAAALVGVGGTAAQAKPKGPLAENVIVMIADGWGFNHNTAGSYYEYGKEDHQLWNRFPVDLAMSTYMAYPEGDDCEGVGYDPALAWSTFGHVTTCATDSAAAATAMATGHKTLDGVIGQNAAGDDVATIVELAEEMGKSTGVVTSVEWSHATPAGFVAHDASRDNYAAIGAEMVDDSAVDVIMGAGHPWYDNDGQLRDTPNTFKYVGGTATWDALVAGTAGGDADADGTADPWTLIQDRSEFQALAEGPTPDRVLGTARVYWTLQQSRSGDYVADPLTVPFTETVPTLEEMTKAALNVLDNDPDGFFLMVEGGAIDWASHGTYDPNSSGRMIEELLDFERAVEAVENWVKENSNWGETVLVVTADHETGYLNGPGSDPAWMPIVDNGTGVLPGMEWHSVDHTNSLVPFFAKGDAARLFRGLADLYDPVHGSYLDNTEMAKALFATLGG